MHHLREESSVNTCLTTIIANEWKNWISDGLAIGYNLSAIAVVFPKLALPLAAAAIVRGCSMCLMCGIRRPRLLTQGDCCSSSHIYLGSQVGLSFEPMTQNMS